MVFKMDGVDNDKALAFRRIHGNLHDLWRQARESGEVTIQREGVLCNPMPKPGQWNFNTTRILGRDATKARDVTLAIIEGRRQVMEVAAFMRRHVPGFAQAVVTETAPHIGVRESRRILGDYTMTEEDSTRPAEFEDAVARGNWFVDIHNPKGLGTKHVHAPKGRYYEIPYRSLRPRGLDNVLVASRCIDTTHEAHAAVRITPQVVAIGQAAGTAAALCEKKSLGDTRQLEGRDLRSCLREIGAFV